MKRGKASVVWELLDVDGGQRLVVDVDAPLRPFGADPTPPNGTPMPGRVGKAELLSDDTLDDVAPLEVPELPNAPAPLPSTEAILRALRGKSRGA